MTRSIAIKNPLPRLNVFSFASNVSIATADGLMRFTSSGKKSCAAVVTADEAKQNVRMRVIRANGMNSLDYMSLTQAAQVFRKKLRWARTIVRAVHAT